MRALCLIATGDPGQLQVLDLPAPRLERPDQVRIGMRAAGLNHLDLWVARAAPGVPAPSLPHVIGTDGAGVVLETGAAVTHVQVGDRVVINPGVSCGACPDCTAGNEVFCRQFQILGEHRPGTAAEELVLPARNVAAIRGDWSWAEAAAFPLVTLTAWRMLVTRARLASDEKVLIWGIGGGVALAALQVARYLGARVAVTSSSETKLARSAEYGIDLGINHATADVPVVFKRHFGGGADVIVDSVGTATWQRSFTAIRPGGRYVTCGATTGPLVELDLRRLFWFQWSVLGSTMGTSSEFATIVALGERGLLRPPVDSVYRLEEGLAAYRRLDRAEQFGKLVLEISP